MFDHAKLALDEGSSIKPETVLLEEHIRKACDQIMASRKRNGGSRSGGSGRPPEQRSGGGGRPAASSRKEGGNAPSSTQVVSLEARVVSLRCFFSALSFYFTLGLLRCSSQTQKMSRLGHRSQDRRIICCRSAEVGEGAPAGRRLAEGSLAQAEAAPRGSGR